ncbi:hypothetical protein NSK_007810 [Nannochloropsis salina CCMP1776]|uniref:Glutamate-1-semialdehyde 2,1-aminomutase n=1 Tax=Nannochloropsis salina CCMP1776 TaxID=1027361 RepID=A0A4D9CTB3_9STRA|nr:hypothetical protein NSK_007810 [Nannochloropsis salina CCMP1776]|eukprot:TFJ80855.1 hypothetical protein NSK_007810 [Nannochloropsis salina CCMP1776]
MMKYALIAAVLIPALATAFLTPVPAKQQVRMMAATMAPHKTDKSSAVFEEAKEGKAAGHAICGGHVSGMFGFFFTEGPVRCFTDAAKSDTAKFAKWHRGMLEHGVYLAPSQYEAGFMSLAHTEADIDATIAAAKEVFKTL